MIENEFKLILTRAQYERIIEEFDWDGVVEQTNYYYDNGALEMSERHITCRVRRIGGEHFLQMKLPNGAAYSRIELEQPLGAKLPEMITSAEMKLLCGVDGLPDVKRLGALKTTRRVKRLEGAEIDLDMSEYFGRTDYELEIEFTDEHTARALLNGIRGAAEITGQGEVCRGKVRRFMDEYLKAKQKNSAP